MKGKVLLRVREPRIVNIEAVRNTENFTGTPGHLLLEAWDATKEILKLSRLLLRALDKSMSPDPEEQKVSWDFRDFGQRILASDKYLVDKINAVRTANSVTILPIKRVGIIFQDAEVSQSSSVVGLVSEDNITESAEEYFMRRSDARTYVRLRSNTHAFSFKDFDAYTYIALKELTSILERTHTQCFETVKKLTTYCDALFILLIPHLAPIYINSNLNSVELQTDIAEFKRDVPKLNWDDAVDYAEFVTKHKEHSCRTLIGNLLTELNQSVAQIAAIKAKHPANISGEITAIHQLLWHASTVYGSLLQYARAINAQIVFKEDSGKSGFSYACDKMISEYIRTKSEHLAGVSPSTTRPRKSSESRFANPSYGLGYDANRTEKGRSVGVSRTNRVNSIGEEISSPKPPRLSLERLSGIQEVESADNITDPPAIEDNQIPSPKETDGSAKPRDAADKKTRSLGRSGDLARLFSPRRESHGKPNFTPPEVGSTGMPLSRGSITQLPVDFPVGELNEAAKLLLEMGEVSEPSTSVGLSITKENE